MNNENFEKEIKFPDGFLWGTSTSAYQIEGGITNDWSEWEKKRVESKKFKSKKLNPADFICGKACDSYNRYKEDMDLAVSLNTNSIRIGIEWARIQPKKDVWDVEAINHYREVLQEAKKRNLKTVVTLWHWTNPLWLANEGGWAKKNVIAYYLKYVDLIIENLGGYIDFWVTLNEPNMFTFFSYITGKFPPNNHNLFKANKVIDNLAKAHNESYKKIHNFFPNANVGMTALFNFIEPANKWNLIEVFLAKILHNLWNVKIIKKTVEKSDFIGCNYYFHDRIVWYPPFKKNLNKLVHDKGWEIYPEGIYQILMFLKKYQKPIYILENGLADKEDNLRVQFIKDHLYYMHKAIEDGADVRGYFHWSLLDNFEWAEGWSPKFGLFAVDRETFARTKRPSADAYAEICRTNRVDI